MAIKPVSRDTIVGSITKDWEFRDPLYRLKRETVRARMTDLSNRMDPRSQPISEQIALEAGWVSNYTDDWPRTSALLDRLEASLAAASQPIVQGADGSWAPGCTEWYRKLEPTFEALLKDDVVNHAAHLPALLPLTFMSRLDKWSYMKPYLDGLKVSDIRRTGRNNRDEFGAVMTALSQFMYNEKLGSVLDSYPELDFKITPDLKASYTQYLRDLQSKDTGLWGPSYRFPDKPDVVQIQDLSFSFHNVHYWLEAKIPIQRTDLIVDSILAVEDKIFPYGWSTGLTGRLQQYSNHNNYDVLILLTSGWEATMRKNEVARKLQMLLDWCLTESLQSDYFATPDGKLTSDSYYYGVRFLEDIGFWGKGPPFWPMKPVAGAPDPTALAQALFRKFVRAVDDGSQLAEQVKTILKKYLSPPATVATA
jgi:hypothetical protein